MRLFRAFIALIVISQVGACTYHDIDAPDALPFEGSFNADIKPIIESRCYSCHSTNASDPHRPGYAFFDDFEELKRYALKKSTVNPSYTTLQARLRYIESPGMPFEQDPLPEEQIRLIESWIGAGAPNN
jgi:uncharacterized membrane protein